MRHRRTRATDVVATVCAALVASAPALARAQSVPASEVPSMALFRVDPLGLDPERAARLEALFRLELERLAQRPLPKKGKVERAVGRSRDLKNCTGEPRCLTAIGKRLGVDRIISGNVGELGDSYVINLKLVDVGSGEEIRRISEPLRGDSDELIDAVRVAAYRLVSPDKLKGQVAILSDVAGAEVFIDGKKVGKTPLSEPIGGLAVGKHHARLVADGYTDFFSEFEVRFQKTTQVVVRMVEEGAGSPGVGPGPVGPRTERPHWLASNWGYVAVGAGAIVLGVILGLVLSGGDDIVDCDKDPAACGL